MFVWPAAHLIIMTELLVLPAAEIWQELAIHVMAAGATEDIAGLAAPSDIRIS